MADDTTTVEALQTEIAALRTENGDLREQQTATTEILRVIATFGNLQPMLDAIAELHPEPRTPEG